jgi:hypothetical protein
MQPKPQDSNTILPPSHTNLNPHLVENLPISTEAPKLPEILHDQSVITDNQVNKAFETGKLVTTQDGAELFTGKTPEMKSCENFERILRVFCENSIT